MNGFKLCLALFLALSSPAWAADKNKPHPHQGKGTRFNSLPAKSTTTAEDEAALRSRIKSCFKNVKAFRPKATRSQSVEVFLVASGFGA